jgi:hypothetical protein
MFYTGLIPLLIFLPNLVLVFAPPIKESLPEKIVKTRSYITAETFEWISRMGILLIPFFSRIALRGTSEIACFIMMLIPLGFYYLIWIRYVVRGRDYRTIYQNFMGVPLPLAVSPVLYFLLATAVLHSRWLGMATIIFGVTHIYISNIERTRVLASDGISPVHILNN